MQDPIVQLVNELHTNAKPSMVWVLEWSKDNEDPIAHAWRKSWTPLAMLALLQVVKHRQCAAVAAVLNTPILFATSDEDTVRAEAIRRIVPVPPTLAEVLASATTTRKPPKSSGNGMFLSTESVRL